MTQVGDEQQQLQENVEAEVDAQQQARRKAWRSLLIPAVGSAAFLLLPFRYCSHSSSIRLASDAFGWTDYALMSIPFVILALGLKRESGAQG